MTTTKIVDSTNTISGTMRTLQKLYDEAIRLESQFEYQLSVLDPCQRKSAANLLHYLRIRQHDIRSLQWARW